MSNKYGQNRSSLQIRKGDLIKKKYNQKFDLILVLVNNVLLDGYLFFISHYERKDADVVYLEPIGATDRLCDQSRMSYQQKQAQKQPDSTQLGIEFVQIESFSNEYNILHSLLEITHQQTIDKLCPVIS